VVAGGHHHQEGDPDLGHVTEDAEVAAAQETADDVAGLVIVAGPVIAAGAGVDHMTERETDQTVVPEIVTASPSPAVVQEIEKVALEAEKTVLPTNQGPAPSPDLQTDLNQNLLLVPSHQEDQSPSLVQRVLSSLKTKQNHRLMVKLNRQKKKPMEKRWMKMVDPGVRVKIRYFLSIYFCVHTYAVSKMNLKINLAGRE